MRCKTNWHAQTPARAQSEPQTEWLKLRTQSKSPPVPFQEYLKELLTCHGENQESQRCFHRGCHRFLPSSATDPRKPVPLRGFYFPSLPALDVK